MPKLSRRMLVRLLHRLDSSPLPIADPVRLALEWEVLSMLAALSPATSSHVDPPVNVGFHGDA